MNSVNLYQPVTMGELFALIARPDYQLLAGGTDLMVRWKRNGKLPKKVVSLQRLEELRRLQVTEKGVSIGALVTVNEIIANEMLHKHYPALVQACEAHSSPLVRNRATVLGNVCNASPAADLVPPLLVYGAIVVIASAIGERSVPVQSFFTGPGKTVLQQGEIAVALNLPMPAIDVRSVFLKEGRRKGLEIAIVNCALSMRTSDNFAGNSELQIALGAVGPTPVFVEKIQSDTSLEKILALTAAKITPISDQRAPEWYRREIAQVLVQRGIELLRAEGGREA